jgi:hypothetical protein
MQSQIYRILAERSGKPLRQIIKDTKRTDFYLDAAKAREYGLIDEVLGPIEPAAPPDDRVALAEAAAAPDRPTPVGAGRNIPADPLPGQPSAPSLADDPPRA